MLIKKSLYKVLNQSLGIFGVVIITTTFSVPTIGGYAKSIHIEEASETRVNLNKAVQKALLDKGYDVGGIDGLIGPKTTAALKIYQKDHNLVADGRLDLDTLKSLGLEE